MFNRLEDACPAAISAATRAHRYARPPCQSRLYMNTDVVGLGRLTGLVKFQEPLRGDDMVVLGRESDWLKAPPPLACGASAGSLLC